MLAGYELQAVVRAWRAKHRLSHTTAQMYLDASRSQIRFWESGRAVRPVDIEALLAKADWLIANQWNGIHA